MQTDLITIVVPVYNVESYLKECIDSICAQSYQNLEIILVDDGSTDSSGSICDAYARKDARITVIHQQNKGLSEARNSGMRKAGGTYLMFVDSDDVVAVHLVEHLAELCHKIPAQIAVCNFLYYNGNHKKTENSAETNIMEQEEALRELCRDRKIKNFAWGKLYERSLFEGIAFPAGQLFEDINTTYKVFLKSDRVVYSSMIGYYYRVRPGAITQTKGIYHALQRICAQQQRYTDLIDRQNGLESILLKQLLYSYVMLAKSYRRASVSERVQQEQPVSEALEFLHRHQKEIEKTAGFDFVERLEYKSLLQRGEKAFIRITGFDYLHKVTKRIRTGS